MNPVRWRTHIEPQHAAVFGVAEAHVAFFRAHTDHGGARDTVAVLIPETPRELITAAMRHATCTGARVVFVTDTAEQADAIAAQAARMLPKHSRIAYELAAAGEWGVLQ